MIIEGSIAVKSALEGNRRHVNTIYINENKSSRDISYIRKLAGERKVTVLDCPAELIDSKARSHTHGGIIAEAGERSLQSLSGMLKKDDPFLVLVEGVEDSYNMGYIMRTLHAFGCDGLILPQRQWDFEDETIIRSSAGASEMLPVHLSSDIQETMEILHQNDFQIISAYRGRDSVNLYRTDLSCGPLLMCIGGPLRGLSREVLDNTDRFVYIPYARDFRNALNAAAATAVLAGEIYRQRYEGE